MPAIKNGLNILHLEGDRLDADLIRDTLTSQGVVANIGAVETESEFRASLLAGRIDLVLSDYSLPGFSGLTALQIVREFNEELPFIFVSGTMGEDIVIESLKKGATDYVLKEGLQRLSLSVRRALGEAKERAERKREVEALNETNQTLLALVQASPLAIIARDTERRVRLWNPAAERFFGWTKSEALGQFLPNIPEEDQAGQSTLRNLFLSSDGLPASCNLETRRLRKDGSIIDVSISYAPLRDTHGAIVGTIDILADITERKHAEEALQTSEIRYRRLFESAKDGILILDADTGQIIDVNPFLMEMLDFTKEEFIGKELWQIGLFKDVAASRMAFAELQERGYIRYENLPLETRDGLLRPVEFVSNSYLSGESRVIQCNIRDITERKRFERILQAKNVELGNANVAKDHFLANMSHELRTPLNAIIGFTGTLLMGLPGPLNPDQEHQLGIVQTSAGHLLSLINDLLDLSKVESGNVELKYEPVVCREVMEEVAAALRPLAESKGLEFNIKAPQASVPIESDRRILSQILINLSNNAIKFTEKGQVQIHLRERSSNGKNVAAIEVIDTGIGIRIEDQKKLFQAFHQVSTDHRTEGTGLGLYVSQRLAVLIKGRIECVSEYGKGSTFRLLIPTA